MKVKILLGLSLCVAAIVCGQSKEEMLQKYPGEEAVVLNSQLFYKISVKDGKPEVQSKNVQQFFYLSANASAYMSKYGFTHSSFHELQEYAAFTKTPDNKKVKVTDFKTTHSKSSGIFYDDVKETSFDFPASSPGAVGTLELNMIHKDARLLSPFYFSRSIPVINSEIRISFPKDMTVKYLLKGNNTDKIQMTQDTRRGEITYTFKMTDVKSERRYADAPDEAYYSPHVIFYIASYKNDEGELVSYLDGLDALHRMNAEFIKDINKEIKPELKHIVDSLTGKLTTQEQKARRIYEWVQQSIKYVAFEEGMEGFIPRDANLVCSRRYGDCKDMSSILTVMLNAAGVPAYYTWIGTTDIPYRYSEVPTPIVDNHMICTIKLNDQYIFLDGTDPSCVFGMPSSGIQGKEAFVHIGPGQYKVLNVPVPPKEKNVWVDSTYLEFTQKGLKGTVSVDMTGYYAMNMYNRLGYMNEKDKTDYYKSFFSRGSNKIKLDKFTANQPDKNNIRLTAAFELQDYARKIGNEWFLNLNLFKFYEHEQIDHPKRKMPVEYSFAFKRKYVTVLQLPPGFEVSHLPKSKKYQNSVWGFEMVYEQKNNQVILTQEFVNDHLLINPDQFAEWNKVLEELLPLYKETLSVSKK